MSIPDFLDGAAAAAGKTAAPALGAKLPSYLDATALAMIRKTRERFGKIPALARALAGRESPVGSNWWVAGGDVTESGYPLLANDPHLGLDTPAIFYEVQMRVSGRFGSRPSNVVGVSFPGTAGVVLGCNPWICWGATWPSESDT